MRSASLIGTHSSPIAGAQYHWTAEHAPPAWRAFASWIQGWITLCGWQAAIASVCFLIATMIQALVVYNNPTYVPQRWQATLMMILLGGMATFGTTIGKKFLPLWETLAGTLHVYVYVVSLI